MSEIKSHEFDGFLQRGLGASRLFLIYGPDRGLVSERASLIAAKSGVPLDDPFCIVKLNAGDLQGDPGRLLDEVNGIGLFGGERLVWIKAAANEKALVDALEILTKDPPPSTYLLIEGGDLKKGAAIRKLAESARSAIAVPCYADDARALNALIDQELKLEGLRITQAARQRLIESLGGDRIASRNEIAKLALYCRGLDLVDEEQVQDIVGDASAISVDDAVDSVLKGDPDALLAAIRRITVSKTPIFLVLQACLRQLQLLDLMRTEMDGSRQAAPQVMTMLGRHLHFRRKPIIESALKKGSTASFRREMKRIQTAIYQSRSRPSLEDSIATHALLASTLQLARG